MSRSQFLTIFPSFEDLKTIQQTLPTILEEVQRNDAALIVHDSSVRQREEIWQWLQDFNQGRYFLVLTDQLSMASARNMCLQLGLERFIPEYVCMLEDDHGFRPGMIPKLVEAMQRYYGKPCPNGLRYGLFTGCRKCWSHVPFITTPEGFAYPDPNTPWWVLGGANSCMRCAPAGHWQAVLKGYDPDEYMISNYQTRHLNFRNYSNGFTTMVVEDGTLILTVDRVGRGYTQTAELRGWDEEYTASDHRSRFRGKLGPQANS
ncbi:MAG: glycosyltransferase family A protein [Bryobacteraceae bacterium]